MSDIIKDNWREIDDGNVVIFTNYLNPSFFHKDIVIFELEDCILKKIHKKSLLENGVAINWHNDLLVKLLKKEAASATIAILTNLKSNKISNKLDLHIMKEKIRFLHENLGVPFIFMMSTKPTKYQKPNTGMFNIIKGLYKKSEIEIGSVKVVSKLDGMNGNEDTDRAFAHNIKADFLTIKDYTDVGIHKTSSGTLKQYSRLLPKDYFENEEKEMPPVVCWNRRVIHPEHRFELITSHNNNSNNLLDFYTNFMKRDANLVLIIGYPCSFKTTTINEIVKTCKSYDWIENNDIKIIDMTVNKTTNIKKVKKYLSERLHIIIECDYRFASESFREKYEDLATEFKIPLTVIQMDVCSEIAELINYARLETSKVSYLLHEKKDFLLYKAHLDYHVSSSNIEYYKYKPKIVVNNVMLEYRF